MEHGERPLKRVTYWQYLYAVHLYVADFGVGALREMVRDIRRDLALLVDAHQKCVDNEELSAAKKTSVYRLSRNVSLIDTLSIHAEMGSEEGGATLEDLVADESSTPSDLVFQSELRELIQEYLESDRLKPMVKKVIALRFGIDCTPLTLDAVGQQLGRTRERVRQMESEGLGHLKWFLREKGFTKDELGV